MDVKLLIRNYAKLSTMEQHFENAGDKYQPKILPLKIYSINKGKSG